MKASKENPIYSAYIVSGGTKYNVTSVLIGIDIEDEEKQMAQSATIGLLNIQVNGTWLTSLISVRDRVFIYANDGTRSDEVFRGFVWRRPYKSGLTDREITLKCYDNLMYFQESEDAQYFSSGKSTEDILKTLCNNWGVNLNYDYESITHTKLALRGTLSDIFTADILDLVKERTGEKYVIRSEKDSIKVMGLGRNQNVYSFKGNQNAIMTRSDVSMDGMVTKVIILGKADEDEREPVEATVSGDTERYGTIQKVINREENTSLADAKKEAQTMIDDGGTPKHEYEVTAVDIPWIRKGDKVYIDAGDIRKKHLIAVSIDRTISNTKKEMTMTLREEKDIE